MKKNLISHLIVVLAITLSIFSCTKQGAEKQLKDQTLLNEDETFIALVNETHDYLKFLANGVKDQSLSKIEISNGLSKLQSKNLPFDDQMKEIDLIFKAAVSSRLKKHMIATQSSMKELESNYGKVDAATINREVEKVLSRKAARIDESNIVTLSASDCGWRYYLCAATATGAAIACHAAIIAPTAGLGTPAAVAICGTAQVYAMVICSDNYCD